MANLEQEKANEAKKMINAYYGDYIDWLVVNYFVDDIDYETVEKTINESIYNACLEHLYRVCDSDSYLGNKEDNPEDYQWRIDDYDTLAADIRYKIINTLELD